MLVHCTPIYLTYKRNMSFSTVIAPNLAHIYTTLCSVGYSEITVVIGVTLKIQTWLYPADSY